MKAFLLSIFLLLTTTVAYSSSGGTVELEKGRLKIQFPVQSEVSKGSFELREILEKHGFQNNEGFVRTGSALAPLELYNFLYEDGKFVFTIFIPADEKKLFVSLSENGFISFGGVAAEKLFEVVKHHLPVRTINNLIQYQWGESSYCDKTISAPVAYRCVIQK